MYQFRDTTIKPVLLVQMLQRGLVGPLGPVCLTLLAFVLNPACCVLKVQCCWYYLFICLYLRAYSILRKLRIICCLWRKLVLFKINGILYMYCYNVFQNALKLSLSRILSLSLSFHFVAFQHWHTQTLKTNALCPFFTVNLHHKHVQLFILLRLL